MKIAVYHNLPSGGAKRSLSEMVKRLSVCHEVDVYTLSCADHDFADLRPFVQDHSVTPFAPLRLLRWPFGRLNQLIYLADLLRLDRLDRTLASRIDRGRYDVVFVHHCRYRQSPAVLRFLKTPTVYYCQEPPRWIYDPPIWRPYLVSPVRGPWHVHLDPLRKLYRQTLRRRDQLNAQSCQTLLVNSHHSRELMWRVYGKEPVVCYLGVDLEAFRPGACLREPMILSVGTVSPIKGYDLLIDGIAKIPAPKRPPLVIISNFTYPFEEIYLKQLAEQRQVSLQIRSLIRDEEELVGWYSRCQLTGYTPVLEPLGLVPLESMACETPVVGVREGGVRETVIDGVTGRLVDRDPDAVAEALSDLLSHPGLASEMGRNGRSWVQEQWTWDRTLARLGRFLIEAASGQQVRHQPPEGE